jgi:inositol oxygenase
MSVATQMPMIPPHSRNMKPVEDTFRNFKDSPWQDRVSNFYLNNHTNQTVEFNKKKREEILTLSKAKMSMMQAVELLNEIVDDSDPDTGYEPQITHCLQTSEAIRKHYPGEEYDWFHLVGFIHDVGKVLAHPTMYNEPQWAVVGDTHVVGCQFPEEAVFHDYFKNNPDSSNPAYNTKFGIYHEGIGLDNVLFSWGHDEYLYQVCVKNGSTLPKRGLFMIRYHSCYPIHQKGAYQHLMTEEDRENVEWLKKFQAFDLYSKLPEKPNIDEVLPYYKRLMDKYFPPVMNW